MNAVPSIGSPAPDFKLAAQDGREIGLADYRDKASVVHFFVHKYN